MELILRIELKTSPLPRECSTAELYEHVFNNHKKQLMDLLKKISRYSNTKTDCRDDLLVIFAMLYIWSGWRESNPRHQLGRLRCYHYTTPAITLIQEDSNRESLRIKSMLGAMTNLRNMVVGEGFEPSKLSRQIYSLLGLTAPQSHLSLL